MAATKLSECGLPVNPHVDLPLFCHPALVKSVLQKLFVKRLREEMEARSLGDAAVARMAKRLGYTMSQSTVTRTLHGKQDPTLEKLHAFADVLGIPPWALLMEEGQIEQRVIRPIPLPPQNVVRLPSPYPPVVPKQADKSSPEKHRVSSKKKRI